MKFHFLTLFPEQIKTFLNEGIIARAIENNLLEVNILNIRDYSKNKHKKVDDYPYGGGAGMLMTPQPIADAIKSIEDWENCEIIYLSPSGEKFTQKAAKTIYDLKKDIIFVCGQYEGIDQRIIDKYITKEYSLGDFILTGGELPALSIFNSVSRLIPGVLGNSISAEDESFSNELLEYPQYTRPEEFEGLRVPDILLSGHHQKISDWRHEKSIEKTADRRPDLYKTYLENQES